MKATGVCKEEAYSYEIDSELYAAYEVLEGSAKALYGQALKRKYYLRKLSELSGGGSGTKPEGLGFSE